MARSYTSGNDAAITIIRILNNYGNGNGNGERHQGVKVPRGTLVQEYRTITGEFPYDSEKSVDRGLRFAKRKGWVRPVFSWTGKPLGWYITSECPITVNGERTIR